MTPSFDALLILGRTDRETFFMRQVGRVQTLRKQQVCHPAYNRLDDDIAAMPVHEIGYFGAVL